MANIFKLTQGYAEKPKRNVYDLSFSNNVTVNFGTLYPVFCKEVNPGDSMKIDTTFGLRAQPMIYPIQTRMRADIHYFYVRNRTLWDNWMDFYGKTKEGLEHPYIDRDPSDFRTKSIYDFFGIPTTVLTDGDKTEYYAVNPMNIFSTQYSTGKETVQYASLSAIPNRAYTNPLTNWDIKARSILSVSSKPLFMKGQNPSAYSSLLSVVSTSLDPAEKISQSTYSWYSSPACVGSFHKVDELRLDEFPSEHNKFFYFSSPTIWTTAGTGLQNPCTVYFFAAKSSQSSLGWQNREIYYTGSYLVSHPVVGKNPDYMKIELGGNSQIVFTFNNTVYNDMIAHGFDLILPVFKFKPVTMDYYTITDNTEHTFSNTLANGLSNIGPNYSINFVSTSSITDTSDMNILPWCGNNKQLKINALPYRAYEAIYNSFYRNVQNDPFKIDGVAEYNKYVTNRTDGADTFPYKLYNRNWELDFLTSSLQSPQQGLAPLVGVTVNNANQTAEFKFRSDDVNNGNLVTATASISENGDVVGIQYYDPDLPKSNIDRLMQAINYGISINDIRQTNSLQRWLEKNIRRGYRYRDQIKSHFGVSVSYSELLMPEFIGGVSQDVETQTIFQTVTNENGYLGDYAGRSSIVGQSRNTVSKYCDEAGFIIGIMSIVPIPVYSQVPAGYAFKNNLMDYYFPEFGKIGMQPIFNYHVTPLQTPLTELNNVFGYQRPWWDLISSFDEVHGEFRSTANGYLIHRLFDETPVLNGNFLKIDNQYINDVFAITDTEVSDQFLGVLNFKVTKKTSIPLHGEPSLE